MIDGKKIRYFDFISSLRYEGCNRALRKIVPRIDMNRIRNIILEMPFITDLQKRFYITMLEGRKERILDFAFAALQ